MVKHLNASEEEILLVPASYNKKGFLVDFQIVIKDRDMLSSLLVLSPTVYKKRFTSPFVNRVFRQHNTYFWQT